MLASRAVVIGGGMSGLFAARVISPHVEHVVILDRDDLRDDALPRDGTPQSHHFHALLPGGMDAMCGWFPGFEDDIVAAGALPMTLGRDFYGFFPEGKSYSPGVFNPTPWDAGTTYVQSRPLLERCVRRRVLGLPNVSVRERVLVEAPVMAGGRVVGVGIRDGSPVETDVVIDASGRHCWTVRHAATLGIGEVPESHVVCDIGYATAVLRPANVDAFDGVGFFVTPGRSGSPHDTRSGSLTKLEDGRWLAGLGGRYGDYPPRDWEGFVAFGASLHHPLWSELVATAKVLEPPVAYRLPRSVRRHYHRLEWFPDGVLPVGDAVCYFNPAYGQGMSAAAGQCRALDAILARRRAAGESIAGLAPEFLPVADEWVRGPWATAATLDFRHPSCTGDFPTDELDDLEKVMRLARSVQTHPELRALLLDINFLRVPLAAIKDVDLAPDGPSIP